MPAFATVADLADHLQTTIAAGQATTAAQMALDAATAEIRSYTGQTISAVDDDVFTLRVGPTTRDIFLPELPVTAVTSVTLDGVALTLTTDYLVDLRLGMLYRPGGVAWGATLDSILVVVNDHGYAVIPDDVKQVCLSAAARVFRGAASPGNVRSESVGGYYSVTYADTGGGALARGDMAVLDSYRSLVVA